MLQQRAQDVGRQGRVHPRGYGDRDNQCRALHDRPGDHPGYDLSGFVTANFGKGAKRYSRGPWQQGKPQQGYQLPMTPEQHFKAGVAAANTACIAKHGKPIDQVTPPPQFVQMSYFGGYSPYPFQPPVACRFVKDFPLPLTVTFTCL